MFPSAAFIFLICDVNSQNMSTQKIVISKPWPTSRHFEGGYTYSVRWHHHASCTIIFREMAPPCMQRVANSISKLVYLICRAYTFHVFFGLQLSVFSLFIHVFFVCQHFSLFFFLIFFIVSFFVFLLFRTLARTS